MNSHNSDPFEWDTEDLVKASCAGSRPWAKDVSQLATRIREQELDGKSLLTYDFILSRHEILSALGIHAAGRKSAVIETLTTLRSQSPLFKAWYRDWKAREVSQFDDSEPTVSPGGSQNAKAENGITTEHHGAMKVSQPPTPHLTTFPYSWSPVSVEESTRTGSKHQSSTPEPEAQVKRQRLAPINISQKPYHEGPVRVQNLGDQVLHRAQVLDTLTGNASPWTNEPSTAYLGSPGIPTSFLLHANGSLGIPMQEFGEDAFASIGQVRLPPGRRLVVNRAVQRLFQENSKKEAYLVRGLEPPSASLGVRESSIDLEDLPEFYDDQTLREIKDEEVELEKRKARQSISRLSKETVRGILDDVMCSIEDTWQQRKLPGLERKAHDKWKSFQLRGRKKELLILSQLEAKTLDSRIEKLYTGILDERWLKASDVRRQAVCLEQSVEDKLKCRWMIALLDRRIAPPRPQPGCLVRRPKTIRKTDVSDEEVLTSSDDEVDFVIPDEPEPHHLSQNEESPPRLHTTNPANQDGSAHDPPITSNFGTSDQPIDLTSTPKKAFVTQTSVESVDPIRLDSQERQQLPPFEQLEFHKIGEQRARTFIDEGDRWRLIICLIWQMPHERRQALLSASHAETSDLVWQNTLERHMGNPVEEDQIELDSEGTTALDMTRIFLSFLKIRHMKEARIMPLKKKEKEKIRAERELFDVFCNFLKLSTSSFPTAQQIYRSDLNDDDLMEEENEDPSPFVDPNTPSRRKARKEIILNREGVDLRAMEAQRRKTQEERRLQLRALMAQTGPVSTTNSHLIINEARKVEDPPIYINPSIGQRIKDHQVNGVRFMWNQLLFDGQAAQGCLLAHTMGLGKTMQVITLLVAIAEASQDSSLRNQIPEVFHVSKSIVLCPASLVSNWVDEFLIWAPEGVLGTLHHVSSKMAIQEREDVVRTWAQDGGIFICGYEMFEGMASLNDDTFKTLIDGANIVIADEAHRLKNRKTKIHQACIQFRTPSRIALTGSPLANHVEEYFAMFDWFSPKFLGPLAEFRSTYANPICQGLWSDSEPVQKRQALRKLHQLSCVVKDKIHRATIKHCMRDELPPKFEFVISLSPTPIVADLYRIYLNGLGVTSTSDCGKEGNGELHEGDAAVFPTRQLFTILHDLVLLVSHPVCLRKKLQDLSQGTAQRVMGLPDQTVREIVKLTDIENIQDLPEFSRKIDFLTQILNECRQKREKVLVFSQSQPTLDYLEYTLSRQGRKVSRLDGTTDVSKRHEMVKDFNVDTKEVYLISTLAGGVGLNIQGASRIVIFDCRWNPVNDQQAIGRAYRIGQKKTVYVYFLITAGSFEDDLHNKAVFKTQLASRVVDKRNPISWSKKRLDHVVHHLRRTAQDDLSKFLGKDEVLDKLIGDQRFSPFIQSIVSTDTFDEEDPESNLTAQEKADAERSGQLDQLRIQNPEAYQAEMLQQQQALIMQSASRAAQMGHELAGGGGGAPPPEMSKIQTFDGPGDAWSDPQLQSSGVVSQQQQQQQQMNNPPTQPQLSIQPMQQQVASRQMQQQVNNLPVRQHMNGQPMPPPMNGQLMHQQRSSQPIHLRANNSPTQSQVNGQPIRQQMHSWLIQSRMNNQPTRQQMISQPVQQANGKAVPAWPGAGVMVPQKPLPFVPQRMPPPVPITGTNTFFGQRPGSEVSPIHGSPTVNNPYPSEKSSQFSQAETTAKGDFTAIVTRRSWQLRRVNEPNTRAVIEHLANTVTEGVQAFRRTARKGFLPDHERWTFLQSLLKSDRFVMAVLSNCFSTRFLALASADDIRARLVTLETLSTADFEATIAAQIRSNDPNNLASLDGLAKKMAGQGAHTAQDLMVMQDALNRRNQPLQRPQL